MLALAIYLPNTASADYGPGLNRSALNGTQSLHQQVEVSKGARIHLQEGQVLRFQDLDQLDPYCYFYSTRSGIALDQPFVVNSEDFLITNVRQRRDLVSSQSFDLAFSGFIGFGGRGGTQYTLATEFRLDNTAQPDLFSLVCAVCADPRDRGHVTLEEIQHVLGGLADFSLAAS